MNKMKIFDNAYIKEIDMGQCFTINNNADNCIGCATFGIFTCCCTVISKDKVFCMGHIHEEFDIYPYFREFINEICSNESEEIKILFTQGDKSCLNNKRNYYEYFLEIKEKIKNEFKIDINLKQLVKHINPINILKIYSKLYYDKLKEGITFYYDNKIKNSKGELHVKYVNKKKEVLTNFFDEELIMINIEKELLRKLKIKIK